MNKTGPIIIIEDDKDDQDILMEIFRELDFKNEVIYFSDGEGALQYLKATKIQPFLILSDINMPRLSGMELRDKVQNNEDLRLKCIPYLFFTTSSNNQSVMEAYSKSIQGFFVKPSHYADLKRTIKIIIEYWKECMSPNYSG
jgi:CheY-like chemotaxis protein